MVLFKTQEENYLLSPPPPQKRMKAEWYLFLNMYGLFFLSYEDIKK